MSSPRRYDVGDLVECSVVFTDAGGAAADPTAVVVKVQDGAGVETTPAAIKDSTGRYHVNVSVTVAGTWWVRFAGTGAIQAATEFSFIAAPTQF